jgi:DNA-binding NarL/FixJ family response regulator
MGSSSDIQTILVLDVQPIWLRAVEQIAGEAGFQATSTSSVTEALRLLGRRRFDLIVVGTDAGEEKLGLPQILARAKRLAPTAKLILAGDDETSAAIQSAFAAGADAYITKHVEPTDLVFAIRQVLAPELYLVSPFVGSRRSTERSPERPFGLTRRESEALELIADGRSNAEIAWELGIAEQTVKGHLWRLYRKLGVSNRTAAARRAEKLRLSA